MMYRVASRDTRRHVRAGLRKGDVPMLQPQPPYEEYEPPDITPHTFGAYLKYLRERVRPKITQGMVVEMMTTLEGCPFNRSTYTRYEDDGRYPPITQVELIYRALRELGAHITPSERGWYLKLAQQRIHEK